MLGGITINNIKTGVVCAALGAVGVVLYNQYGQDVKKMFSNTMKSAKKDTKQVLNQIQKNM